MVNCLQASKQKVSTGSLLHFSAIVSSSPEKHTHPQANLWHPQAQIFFLYSSELLHLECETMRPGSFVCVISHRATIWPVRDQWGQTIDLTKRALQGGPSGAVACWVPCRLHALSISWQRSMRRAGDRGHQTWADGMNACLHTELDFWSSDNCTYTHTSLSHM